MVVHRPGVPGPSGLRGSIPRAGVPLSHNGIARGSRPRSSGLPGSIPGPGVKTFITSLEFNSS